VKIPTLINKCEGCRFYYLYADLDGIKSGCKKPEWVNMDCFGALERREKENEH